jgi:hypothetical protein
VRVKIEMKRETGKARGTRREGEREVVCEQRRLSQRLVAKGIIQREWSGSMWVQEGADAKGVEPAVKAVYS